MRAILDPNVFVSALLSPKGTPAKIYLAWLAGDFDVIISARLIEELERALGHPKIRKTITKQESDEFIEVLFRLATTAEDPIAPSSVQSSDPGDDYLLALAESQSAALVSGDTDVLDLGGDLPIYSPRQFLDLIEGLSTK